MVLVKSLILFLLFLPFLAHSQIKSIGTPNILSYPKSVYHAGTQNWDVAQDKNGFMYFANNDGVLKFDGFHWDLLSVPLSLVRSVMVDSKNRIFVGLLYDFGMLEQDESGKLSYHSLLDLVPKDDRGFNDVWKIHENNGNIIFQSYEKMFIYDGRMIHTINPSDKFHFSFKINERLLIHEPGEGLYELYGNYIDKLPWAEPLKNFEILSILEIEGNRLLIGTSQNGFFYYYQGRLVPWNTEVNEFIKTNKLFSAITIDGNLIALGTILNGVVITNENGKILQHLNRSTGLHNNTILSMYTDKEKNLWLGLDNGINYVEINSPTSYITDKGEIGTGYCCQIFDEKLYVGTNQGLFVKPFNNFLQSNENFSLVENSEGQVWSLGVFDGELICGHNNGTYTIEGQVAKKISEEPGAWRFIQLKNNKDVLLGGSYTGLVILRKGLNGWEYKCKIKGFNESSRFLFQNDDGAIWMSHGGKGIYKFELNSALDSVEKYSLYKEEDGLPSDEQNIQFQLDGKNYVSTIGGIYKYNSSTNSFVMANEMNQLFEIDGRIKTVETDENDNIWYISHNESGVLRKNEDLTYTKIVNPFKALSGMFVSEFEFIYPYNNDHIIFGIDKGFAHYSSKFPKSYIQEYKSYITKVELSYLDSVVLVRQDDLSLAHKFPFKRNSLRFHFAAPFYENLIDLRFSYFLESYSEKWSEWSADNYRDFTNLSHGTYRFKVKAVNNYGVESGISEFDFIIQPPWYQSRWAYGIYIFSALCILLSVIVFIRYRIRKSEESEKIKHEKSLKEKENSFQLQSVVAEKEIIRLRNDKLRAEKLYRDKELANQTMSIVQKNKFLVKLNLELQRIQNVTEDNSVVSKLTLLKKKVDKEIDNKQHNKMFETYFDEVHNEFFERLKLKYPQLSPKEVRLCAYMRMNISTKEIATLLNITDRGVEVSRYRLRKKMELTREINLPTFLSNI